MSYSKQQSTFNFESRESHCLFESFRSGLDEQAVPSNTTYMLVMSVMSTLDALQWYSCEAWSECVYYSFQHVPSSQTKPSLPCPSLPCQTGPSALFKQILQMRNTISSLLTVFVDETSLFKFRHHYTIVVSFPRRFLTAFRHQVGKFLAPGVLIRIQVGLRALPGAVVSV